MSARQFLFLQGLPGDFFADLAQSLQKQGNGIHRVNFNGGDVANWPLSGAIHYHGPARHWPSFLARLISSRGITDIVLFGDCRPLHRVARATAAGLGVIVHVFEEGYIRPDWITLELGGVNGFSPLPNDPDWYLRAAKSLPGVPDRVALPSAIARRARASIAYYAAALSLAWAFPFYRTHRPWNPLLEAGGWLMRYCGRKSAAIRSAAAMACLGNSPYFIFPLQLNSDYQLRAHSDFDGMQPALAEVIASFARHAPAEAKLVVKSHPLDNGLADWRRRTLSYAGALGVQDRIVFLETGDIGLLVRGALGVITINSTTGTLALEASVPVITLGRSIYDLPGLTHQGALAQFWTAPERPDIGLYSAFRQVLVHRCLLHGGFYDASTRHALIAAASRRLLSARPLTLVRARSRIAPSALLVPAE